MIHDFMMLQNVETVDIWRTRVCQVNNILLTNDLLL